MKVIANNKVGTQLRHKLEANIRKSKAGRDALVEAAKSRRKQVVETASSHYAAMLGGIKNILAAPNFGIDTEYGGYPQVHQVLLVKDGKHNTPVAESISVTQKKGWDALSTRWRKFKDQEGLEQGYWKAYDVVYHLFSAALDKQSGELYRRPGTLGEYGLPLKILKETADGLKVSISVKYPALPIPIDKTIRGSFVSGKELPSSVSTHQGWKTRTYTFEDMASAEAARPWLGLFAAEAGKRLRNSLEKL